MFECGLGGGAWALCPATAGYRPDLPEQIIYTGLANGPHTFAVRAFDLENNVDPSPPNVTFTVSA